MRSKESRSRLQNLRVAHVVSRSCSTGWGCLYVSPVIAELRQRGWAVLETQLYWGDWSRRGIDAGGDDGLRQAGMLLAGIFDERLAELAYAVEAALEHLAARRPDLRPQQVVLVGFSLGAIAGPTVAARLTDRLRAVVLVGGALMSPASGRGRT